jgi:hypothetical protein
MNSTFRGDEVDYHFNACVGDNGWVDADTYVEGYDIAVRRLCDAALNNEVPVDAVIYPIAYSARHRIELSLKGQIKAISKVTGDSSVEASNVSGKHDLAALWSLFSHVSASFDRRYGSLVARVQEKVLDFATIDPNGQTFRYPHDTSGAKHLVKTRVISVRVLKEGYLELDDTLRTICSLTEQLVEEYALGTRTSSLSRRDIEDISLRLTTRDQWNLASFDSIRRNLMAEYKISSNEFSKALNLVQRHHAFAANIGLEVSCIDGDRETFIELARLKSKQGELVDLRRLSVQQQMERLRAGLPQPVPSSEEQSIVAQLDELLGGLSDDRIAELVSVAEWPQWQFCERYATHLLNCKSEMRFERRRTQQKVVLNTAFVDMLRQGLRELGQMSLASRV